MELIFLVLISQLPADYRIPPLCTEENFPAECVRLVVLVNAGARPLRPGVLALTPIIRNGANTGLASGGQRISREFCILLFGFRALARLKT